MTEKSYFHNGAVRGDANQAPYSSLLFSGLINAALSTTGCYVLPNISDNGLEVTAGVGRSVYVSAGEALIYGVWYKNDPAIYYESLSLDENDAAYPRIDRIVVRWSYDDNEARLAVVKGIPARIPEPPVIDNCENSREMSLARVYLPAGYAAVSSSYIFDERRFANNAWHINHYSLENIAPNSEFLAWSNPEKLTTPGVTKDVNAPEGWNVSNWPPNAVTMDGLLYGYEKFSFMRRGRTAKVESDVAGDGLEILLLTSENFQDMFTLRIWVEVERGNCQLTWAGQTRLIEPTNGPVEILLRVSTTGYQTLRLESVNDDDIFILGALSLAYGFVEADIVNDYDEFIPFVRYVPGTNEAGLSTGTYTYTSDEFHIAGAAAMYDTKEKLPIMTGIKAFMIEFYCRDSGSLASITTKASLQNPTTGGDLLEVWCTGLPNDTYVYTIGIIYVDDLNINEEDAYEIDLDIVASGAGTMDAGFRVIGVVI